MARTKSTHAREFECIVAAEATDRAAQQTLAAATEAALQTRALHARVTCQPPGFEKQAVESADTSADPVLNKEAATLRAELAELVREQAEMDKIRAEEKGAFEVNSAEMEKGLNGIRMALKVLND